MLTWPQMPFFSTFWTCAPTCANLEAGDVIARPNRANQAMGPAGQEAQRRPFQSGTSCLSQSKVHKADFEFLLFFGFRRYQFFFCLGRQNHFQKASFERWYRLPKPFKSPQRRFWIFALFRILAVWTLDRLRQAIPLFLGPARSHPKICW